VKIKINGEKFRNHFKENFEGYALGAIYGAVMVGVYLMGSKVAESNVKVGFKFGQKAGWYKGFEDSLREIIANHTVDKGEPILYTLHDGTQYLISAAAKEIAS
jgi:hypothetical protein